MYKFLIVFMFLCTAIIAKEYSVPSPEEFLKMQKEERSRHIMAMWDHRKYLIKLIYEGLKNDHKQSHFATKLEWEVFLLTDSKNKFLDGLYNMMLMDRDIEFSNEYFNK